MEVSGQTAVLRVDSSKPGARIDRYLREQFPALSRGAFQRLIQEGHVRVNGARVKPTYAPRTGDLIEIAWPEARPAEAQPESMPLDLLYEDEDLLVLNKPPGLVIHPAAGHRDHTLVNALLHHCQGRLSGVGGVARPGIVHRLDKETSGCLVVAKNDPTHMGLSHQFASREVEKIYHALVCGRVAPDAGEIDAAIARHPSHRKRMAVRSGGRSARTTLRVLERFSAATLVEAHLHTGRTHQIRVHFQSIGHPLAGDSTYGQRQNRRLAEEAGVRPARQMLHARQLAFTHPRSGRRMTFRAEWPPDFAQWIERLRQGDLSA